MWSKNGKCTVKSTQDIFLYILMVALLYCLFFMNINIVESVQMCMNSICQFNVQMLVGVLSRFAVLFH